jgi:P-type Cu2+ transporter
VAIGSGTDVVVEAGDVVLVRSDPRDVPRLVELSRATYRKMVQNLWWAAGYNIIAIPLAAGILQPWGIVLNPAVGAVLMSASTVIVAINAQLLRRRQWSAA